jgi:succinate dehydrogenase / fumarate reductase cytochrome b subunit
MQEHKTARLAQEQQSRLKRQGRIDSRTLLKQQRKRTMERPLSPFMFPTWYRFQITSVLSILHRLTGIALAVGSILLAWWLVAIAAGGDVFAATHAFLVSPIGLLLLFGWSVAFFYHLCSGIRHLVWDAGYGFEIRSAYRSGYAVLAATVVLTVLTWLYVFLA